MHNSLYLSFNYRRITRKNFGSFAVLIGHNVFRNTAGEEWLLPSRFVWLILFIWRIQRMFWNVHQLRGVRIRCYRRWTKNEPPAKLRTHTPFIMWRVCYARVLYIKVYLNCIQENYRRGYLLPVMFRWVEVLKGPPCKLVISATQNIDVWNQSIQKKCASYKVENCYVCYVKFLNLKINKVLVATLKAITTCLSEFTWCDWIHVMCDHVSDFDSRMWHHPASKGQHSLGCWCPAISGKSTTL